MSDQSPIISTNIGEFQPNSDITSDNEPADYPSVTSCSDSELSDIPSSKSSRPLSLVNPTSVQLLTPRLSSTIDYKVLSDFKRIARSLTISSSSSSNFEISDYEGDCSSDDRTPSPALAYDVITSSCDGTTTSNHDDDVMTTLLPCRQMRVIEEGSGEEMEDEDRSTTSSCEEERHEVALHPPARSQSPLSGGFSDPGLKHFLPDQAQRLREHYAALAAQESQDSEGLPSSSTRYSHHTPFLNESQETLMPSGSSTNSVQRSVSRKFRN